MKPQAIRKRNCSRNQENLNSGNYSDSSDDSAYYLRDIPLDTFVVEAKLVVVEAEKERKYDAKTTASSKKMINSINQEKKKSKKNRQSYYGYYSDSSDDSANNLLEIPSDIEVVKKKYAEVDVEKKRIYDSETSTSSKKTKFINQEKKKGRKTKCRRNLDQCAERTSRNQENPVKNPNQENPDQETSGDVLVNDYVVNQGDHGGAGSVLFIEKELTRTDASDYHQRLSVSRKQIISDEFLTREEMEILRKKKSEGVEATLIDPCGMEYDVTLKMERSGLKCDCYKIPKPWNQIRKNSGIGTGMVIQLWASRRNGSKLFFNLVRIK